MGKTWPDERVKIELCNRIADLGHMPSARELDGALRNAVVRSGGFPRWAKRLGVQQRDSNTKTGRWWQGVEVKFWRGLGCDVEEQRHKASFDLLVNGEKIDVKSAHWSSYKTTQGRTAVEGWVFAGLKYGRDCDYFDLLCVEGAGVLHRFVIPSLEARVQSLTITRKTIEGRSKYSKFENAAGLVLGMFAF